MTREKAGITGGQFVRPTKAELARRLRRTPTPAEKKAWALLRNRGILGLKFRRQQVIHGFIADFYCPELKLALELDGPIHHKPEVQEYDRERDRALKALGIQTCRIPNDLVSRANLERIITQHLPQETSFF